jgi:tetratricopeptide (TPR) repeat protein
MKSRGVWLWPLLAGAAVAMGAVIAYTAKSARPSGKGTKPAAYVGSASCRECHADAYETWAKSSHGLAERPVQLKLDESAFLPGRSFRHGSQTTSVQWTNGSFFITSVGLSGRPEAHPVDRVLGHDPLRQFLVAAPGGRWQAMEAAFDPRRNEWFNVFGDEDRQPGEWGHWSGRGMNWNSMCAECHNTGLQKNYDETADAYHTTMIEASVSCEACHGPLQPHVQWQKRYRNKGMTDPTMPKLTPARTMDICASCHALRTDLTGDFRPGDAFYDHYDLAIVDHRDAFYPDGQVHGEDYEFTAFLGSKMRQAGVTCLDCHPRSLHGPRVVGNVLCLRCHGGGFLKAPIIQPEAHSHHLASGKGDECVGCHMPTTVYMQKHARHDHGFTIPDPLLTKELGVPNACNRCHPDKDVEWSLAAVDKWYGTKMDRPTRRRAEWIAQAREGDPAAREPLLALTANNENPYWQAVAVTLLDQWVGDTKVNEALFQSLTHRDPLVRANAVRVLKPLVDQQDATAKDKIRQLLADPCRNVRVSAAWVLSGEIDTNTAAGRELLRYLDYNADQPAGQVQKGAFYFARGDLPEAARHYQKAVAWDPNSAPLRRELALCLSSQNQAQEAIGQLEAACRLAPKEAEYRYELGLAWNEAGDLTKAIAALQAAVEMDPRNERAWYNLGLARETGGQTAPALEALTRAESLSPNDPRVPYARATILAKAGRIHEAKAAAQRALALQPGYVEAAQLIQSLSVQGEN